MYAIYMAHAESGVSSSGSPSRAGVVVIASLVALAALYLTFSLLTVRKEKGEKE